MSIKEQKYLIDIGINDLQQQGLYISDIMENYSEEVIKEKSLAYENRLADVTEMYEEKIKETEQRVSHYANFLEKELAGDGYIIEAIRERYERHFKGGN